MGELVHFRAFRARQRGAASAADSPPDLPAAVTALRPGRVWPPRLFFDLGCPFSYLAVEQAERALGRLDWVPVLTASAPEPGTRRAATLMARAEALAGEYAVPLVWPEAPLAEHLAGLRMAAWAAARGRGGEFARAAGRLAFCGGFDLDDPAVLGEAAAAAGLDVRAATRAAANERRDQELLLRTVALRERGLRRLPVLRLGARWLSGRDALEQLSSGGQRLSALAGGD